MFEAGLFPEIILTCWVFIPRSGGFSHSMMTSTQGANPVTVLSYGFWERRFGKDPALVGKQILLNEHAMTVIGIAAPEFYGTELSDSPDVFVPLMMTSVFIPVPANRMQSHTHQWLTLMARRKPGVSMTQAQASLEVLYQQLREVEAKQLMVGESDFARKQFFARVIEVSPGNQGLAICSER